MKSLWKVGHIFQCTTINKLLKKGERESKGTTEIKNKIVQEAKTPLKSEMKIEKQREKD